MLCEAPITIQTGGFHERMLVGCGQCMPCRISKRRVWVHRIMLEAALHKDNAFVTLTYSPDKLTMVPGPGGLPTLVPADLRNFLKRLRKALEPARIRYFAAGEYGDRTELPHFHLAIFGLATCWHGRSTYSATRTNCCPSCDLIRDTWGNGLVYLGTLEDDSAQYIAGYVLKKMTSSTDTRLAGRHPEFARMSNRPGIGADMMHEVASTLLNFNLETTQADVPVSLRHGSRQLPLGRYLTGKLRSYVGKDPGAPQAIKEERAQELQRLRDASADRGKGFGVRGQYREENLQKLRQVAARERFKRKDKKL